VKPIPPTEFTPVLRTDFSSTKAWDEIVRKIQKPVGIFRFRAQVSFLSDPEYQDLTQQQVLKLLPKNFNHSFLMIADRKAMVDKGHPLLIVDLFTKPGREFRAVPSQIQGIENNLSLGNMDFEDFADTVDSDGVFRGFPPGPGLTNWLRKWIFGG
jgi:hypothetical protein